MLAQLHSADLLQTEVTPDSAELLERAAKVDRARWLGNILNPLAVRLRFWHPDRFLERTLPLVNWLVGWRGGVLWMIVVLPAIVLCAQHWQELSENAADRILAADNILMMALSFLVLKALHELGHGYAVKAFGGIVHEIGIMFLVFAPMPYVDASAASEFRSKWRRALVGAAGMIVEVFIAALALYVWLAVEQGLVRAFAYNVMLVAGISTVLFNGNPLLRYDGYYILSDLLEIPNLAQRATRYWGYLVDSYVFRTEGLPEFVATAGRANLALTLRAGIVFVPNHGDARDRHLCRFGISRRWCRDSIMGAFYGRRPTDRQGALAGLREPALAAQPYPRRDDDMRSHPVRVDRPVLDPGPALHDDGGRGLAPRKRQRARWNRVDSCAGSWSNQDALCRSARRWSRVKSRR